MTDGLVIELTATEATAVEPGDSIKVEFPVGDELTSSPLSDASPRAPALFADAFTHDLCRARIQETIDEGPTGSSVRALIP